MVLHQEDLISQNPPRERASKSSRHLGPSRLRRTGLVARNDQDVTGAALGEVRLRLVDPGLHHNCALPPVHAALDGAGDVDLQLPPLAAERKERRVTGRSKVTQVIKVYSNSSPSEVSYATQSRFNARG